MEIVAAIVREIIGELINDNESGAIYKGGVYSFRITLPQSALV